MKDYFSFSHDYFKLKWNSFTTIRGMSSASQYKEGQIVEIIKSEALPSNGAGVSMGKARIVMIEVIEISKISIEILRADAAFPGFTIRTPWDFVGLINSFRQYEKSKIPLLNVRFGSAVILFRQSYLLMIADHGLTQRQTEKRIVTAICPERYLREQHKLFRMLH